MLAKEMALEVASQAPAGADATAVLRQPTYIICDAPCQDPDTDIVPLPDIERVLDEAAQQLLINARQALTEAQARIETERAARFQQLSQVRATVGDCQEQLATLDTQRAQYEKRARVFLAASDRERMLAQIRLAFDARQLELETALAEQQRTLDSLEGEEHAATLAEELELQLVRGDIETLEQAAPDVAERVQLTYEAPQHLENALCLARDGAIADAERELALARSGGIEERDLVNSQNAILEAKRRGTVRELIAQIHGVQIDAPGAVHQLRQLERRAVELAVASNVEPFLNHALKLARVAAGSRYREAELQADHLADQGLIPCVGDGRIEAWRADENRWTLVQFWTFQEGVWVGHQPRARITRSEVPRRVKRSPWYRRQRSAGNAA